MREKSITDMGRLVSLKVELMRLQVLGEDVSERKEHGRFGVLVIKSGVNVGAGT